MTLHSCHLSCKIPANIKETVAFSTIFICKRPVHPTINLCISLDTYSISALKMVTVISKTSTVSDYNHMVRHPRFVFINYNWINQLSNTNIWWLFICCLLHRYQLHVSALMAIFRLIDWQQTCKQLYFGMRLVVRWRRVGVGWGYEISCVLSREGDVGASTHNFSPRKYSWYSFLLEADSTPGPQCDQKDIMSMKNSNDTSWDRTSDLPICSTAP
jgi:hypothetical protein